MTDKRRSRSRSKCTSKHTSRQKHRSECQCACTEKKGSHKKKAMSETSASDDSIADGDRVWDASKEANKVGEQKQKEKKTSDSYAGRAWEAPALEDLIYYLTKRERHRQDEMRRVEDWLEMMDQMQRNGSKRPFKREDDDEAIFAQTRRHAHGHRRTRRSHSPELKEEDARYARGSSRAAEMRGANGHRHDTEDSEATESSRKHRTEDDERERKACTASSRIGRASGGTVGGGGLKSILKNSNKRS